MAQHLVSYDEYKADRQKEIERLRSDWQRGRSLSVCWDVIQFGLLFVGVGLVLALAITGKKPAVGELPDLSVIGLMAVGVAFVMRAIELHENGKKSLLDAMYRNQHFTCPHCEKNVATLRKWKCGWCSEEFSGERNLVFNACSHSVCGERLNGVQCPYCGQDVILRENSYIGEQSKSVRRVAGVVTFPDAAVKKQPEPEVDALSRDIG